MLEYFLIISYTFLLGLDYLSFDYYSVLLSLENLTRSIGLTKSYKLIDIISFFFSGVVSWLFYEMRLRYSYTNDDSYY